jgi:hypothetical protein
VTDSDDGTETVLFEEMIDENVRFQGYEISIHYKITNYLTVVGGMVFALVAGNLSRSQAQHCAAGVGLLVFEAVVWLFETAVSSQHAEPCPMRLAALNGDTTSVMFQQGLERMSTGTCAVVLIQALLWTFNICLHNTGFIPTKVIHLYLGFGLLYAYAIGRFSTESRHACSSDFGMHQLDVWAPIWLALISTPIIVHIYARPFDANKRRDGDAFDKEDDQTAAAGSALIPAFLGPPFRSNYVMWQKEESMEDISTRPDVGLTVCGINIKPAKTVLTLTGIKDSDSSAAAGANEDSFAVRWIKRQIWANCDHASGKFQLPPTEPAKIGAGDSATGAGDEMVKMDNPLDRDVEDAD